MEEQKVRKMKELKNGRSKVLSCNFTALENLITARGFKMHELAELMGYDKSYFNKVKSRGMIGSTCVRLLQERYGVLPQMYDVKECDTLCVDTVKQDVRQKVLDKLKKPEPEAPQLVTIQVQLDTEQFAELIKKAVLDAFNSL